MINSSLATQRTHTAQTLDAAAFNWPPVTNNLLAGAIKLHSVRIPCYSADQHQPAARQRGVPSWWRILNTRPLLFGNIGTLTIAQCMKVALVEDVDMLEKYSWSLYWSLGGHFVLIHRWSQEVTHLVSTHWWGMTQSPASIYSGEGSSIFTMRLYAIQ